MLLGLPSKLLVREKGQKYINSGNYYSEGLKIQFFFESVDQHFYRTLPARHPLEQKFGGTLKITEDSPTPLAFSRAREWLAHCLNTHGSSCQSPVPGKPPRRLIRVGAEATASTYKSQDTVFLEEISPEDSRRYTCPSYRWGVPISGDRPRHGGKHRRPHDEGCPA